VLAAIVFAAAPLHCTPRLAARLSLIDHPFIVAADGGASTALAFGFRPDLIIGDLDSIGAATLSDLQDTPVERYSRDKDLTDGQLAIERALQVNPSELWLLGFLGGPRLDQALANVLLLPSLEVPATLLDEQNECRLLRAGAPCTWRPEPDETVSLLPLGGDAHGVVTRGLRWRLDHETLKAGDTRGVSNEPIADEAAVSIDAGLLLVTRHFTT
jgi:thiamine pyrophosphokinase